MHLNYFVTKRRKQTFVKALKIIIHFEVFEYLKLIFFFKRIKKICLANVIPIQND